MNKVLKILLDRRYRLFQPLRTRRHQLFLRVMRPGSNSTILDVGGTPGWWNQHNYQGKVVLANIQDRTHYPNLSSNFEYVQADGRRLLFQDKNFDIVFSNSVIEHVGTWVDQVSFAQEIRRVGKTYWIQTPSRSFPFEPHFNCPLFQYLPLSIRLIIAKDWPLSWPKRYGQDAQEFARSTRLLNAGQLRDLFPDGKLYRERFVGLTKSIVVWKVGEHV